MIREKLTKRVYYIFLYSAFAVMPIWAGGKLINLVLDHIFISNFVDGWQQIARHLEATISALPPLRSGQLAARMHRIERLAARASLTLPATRTRHSYTYHLKKINQPVENIFLAVESTRIIIYGLRKQTMRRLDKYIDGTENIYAGRFQALPGKNPGTYTGVLQL
ncbi:MAG: hypothetical protein GXP59_01095 [Deltaproteobacteria bacterium]|nr:hypothetical protein [Deltaproteobacteria bacterium]